jgi:hypothetical protein
MFCFKKNQLKKQPYDWGLCGWRWDNGILSSGVSWRKTEENSLEDGHMILEEIKEGDCPSLALCTVDSPIFRCSCRFCSGEAWTRHTLTWYITNTDGLLVQGGPMHGLYVFFSEAGSKIYSTYTEASILKFTKRNMPWRQWYSQSFRGT